MHFPLVLSGIFYAFFASSKIEKRYWNFTFSHSPDPASIYSEKPNAFLMVLEAIFTFLAQFSFIFHWFYKVFSLILSEAQKVRNATGI